MVIRADLQEVIEKEREMEEKLTAMIEENTRTYERFTNTISSFHNLNERQNPDSRKILAFEKMVAWRDDLTKIEKSTWEYKKQYNLKMNPRQENLQDLVDLFIDGGYTLTIADPHFVLSLPTELQSYREQWFVGWDQELHIYAKKADEEIMFKKEVVWYSPVFFWCTDVHYELSIFKNKSQIEDKTLLDFIKYGEENPSLGSRMAKKKTTDEHIFARWVKEYIHGAVRKNNA